MEADGRGSEQDGGMMWIEGGERGVGVKGRGEVGMWRGVEKGKHMFIEGKVGGKWDKGSEREADEEGELVGLRV